MWSIFQKCIATLLVASLFTPLFSLRAEEVQAPEEYYPEEFEATELLPSSNLSEEVQVGRLLLIACDNFITQKSTQGACEKNAETVARGFAQADLGVESIMRSYNLVADEEDFANAVITAFEESDENDLNIVYISTHGLYDPEKQAEGALLLSDGEGEGLLQASDIVDAFSHVLGNNLLIVDACYSGALIGKGVSGGGFGNPFYAAKDMVLASSGGSELSWYWVEHEESDFKLVGAGYFSAMLAQAIDKVEGYPCDLNHDGEISLEELYQYLFRNNGSSVAQVYPQGSDFVLFSLPDSQGDELPKLTNIYFYNQYIDSGHPTVNFSFEVNEPVVPLYQIVYFRDGKWDFDNANFVYDVAALDEEESLFPLDAGLYRRKVAVMDGRMQGSGYAMLNILTREGKDIKFLRSKVIGILGDEGITEMEVYTADAFQPQYGQELPILVSHNVPCLLSLSVVDEAGENLYTIVESRMTRPENLRPNGSSFVWHGRLANGQYAPPGKYYIRSLGLLQNQIIERYSKPFEILKPARKRKGG